MEYGPITSTATATGLSAGTYTVTVTDGNGCSTTASATISQPQAALGASISSKIMHHALEVIMDQRQY